MELSKLMGCVKRHFIPSELFRDGLIGGAWFDPSDMSTLYQDAAGTIPVTAVEQPVGLMLDKSRGLMLGPELVVNGDFGNGTDGWATSGAYPATITATDYVGNIVSTGFDGRIRTSQMVTRVGGIYKISVSLISNSSTIIFRGSSESSQGVSGTSLGEITASTPGIYEFYFKATTTTSYLWIIVPGTAGNTCAIDNISVRELYGNHATQSVTASRPVLSARYNLLTKTEDFSDAVWTKTGITLSQALGPNGVTGAYKITEDLTTGTHRLSQAVSSSASSYIVYIKNNGANYCAVSWRGNTDIRYDVVRYNLLTKSKIVVQDASGLYVSDSIVDIGDGWLKITITLTSAAQFHVACANPTKDQNYLVTYTGDGVSGLIVYHPQVSPSVITQYQRVNTATDYDTDELYFPKYLRFDGVDDYLNLPYMGLYAGGGMSIIAARDAVSQSTDTYIISERSTTSTSPKYLPSRQLANARNMDAYISDDAGAVILDTAGSPFSGVANAVIRSIVDSGNNLKLFKNGVLAANDNYTRSGTLTLDNTTIGASVSTTTSNYASMKLYGLIVTKSALTDAQRIACERHLSRKSGVQL